MLHLLFRKPFEHSHIEMLTETGFKLQTVKRNLSRKKTKRRRLFGNITCKDLFCFMYSGYFPRSKIMIGCFSFKCILHHLIKQLSHLKIKIKTACSFIVWAV